MTPCRLSFLVGYGLALQLVCQCCQRHPFRVGLEYHLDDWAVLFMSDWHFLSIQPVSEGDTVTYVFRFPIFCCFNFWVLKYYCIVYQLKFQASVWLNLYPLDDFEYGCINCFKRINCIYPSGSIHLSKIFLYLMGQVCQFDLLVSLGSNLKIELLHPFIVFIASVPVPI